MNLLAALLVVVRYTLHNVKTFILVIYCVVLRISFVNCIIVLLGLLMSQFGSSSLRTSSVLIIFCSFCGMNWRFIYLPLSSNLPPLFLHSFTIKPLDLHWTHTGLTLDSPSTATNTYPLSYFTHATTHLKALQRCSVAALHATFLNH